jgi:hypothetical protein
MFSVSIEILVAPEAGGQSSRALSKRLPRSFHTRGTELFESDLPIV